MYGQPSDASPLEWSWVEAELVRAGTYWVVPHGAEHPHPRPVWGVWNDERLHLSVGSPVVTRLLDREPAVTVHLDSGVDVVVVEGSIEGFTELPYVYRAYNEKYDWNYTIEEFGRLTVVAPSTILAWRAAGWAGRDGFQQSGAWRSAPDVALD